MNDIRSLTAFWFRRDLRLEDNAGLYHALRNDQPVLPVFIFDTEILDKLDDKTDLRVQFIHQELSAMQEQLAALGSGLVVKHGSPLQVWKELCNEYPVKAVYTNHDHESYARERDKKVEALLKENGAGFNTLKDIVVFEKDEVTKDDGLPYTVFTPYSRKWRAALTPFYSKAYPTKKYFNNFYKEVKGNLPTLKQLGFHATDFKFPAKVIQNDIVKSYDKTRDFPAIDGTSKLGIHLRFGTLSIRKLLGYALQRNDTFVNELIWRDFYHQILWHFPHVERGAFKQDYDRIEWRNNEEEFERWCQGQTGIPLVDAGMRELNETGYMHNRVRMVVASFLTKNLLIDWRWGEAYFAKKLLDFDLASNNGGWQWAAGCGTDAAPYFRIFNPIAQTQRFDPKGEYIRKWVPDLLTATYAKPIVDLKQSRERCLKVYQKALKP